MSWIQVAPPVRSVSLSDILVNKKAYLSVLLRCCLLLIAALPSLVAINTYPLLLCRFGNYGSFRMWNTGKFWFPGIT